jgi:hypothetical protein
MTIEELIAALSKDGADSKTLLTEYTNENTQSVTEGLKNKNHELISTIKKLKQSASDVPDDFDSELWNSLIKDKEDKKTTKLRDEEKWDELKNSLTQAHSASVVKLESRNEALRSALSDQLIDNAAVTAINEAKGNAALLLPHIKARLQMIADDDGTFSAVVSDTSGSQAYSKIKAGEVMGLDELVGEFKANESYAAAFMPENSGGGAGGSGSAGTNGMNPFAKGKGFSYTKQAAMVKSNPNLASQMKSAAESE